MCSSICGLFLSAFHVKLRIQGRRALKILYLEFLQKIFIELQCFEDEISLHSHFVSILNTCRYDFFSNCIVYFLISKKDIALINF